ncbi:MAG: cob(I)yrinic acid a,c-diamide adenosyltransferase [Oscillospiraceae bacterium]|nr:cob(I)yrinic acid a,c-diamide adenosyltransferase [Oscillospiraceae bacterium]
MVHLYCGEGKGKTTAAMGLALRMAGRGRGVVVAQFLKGADSGERLALAQVPGVQLLEVPERVKFSFRLTPAEREAERARNTRLLALAREAACAPACGLLVLDEVCAAVNTGLLPLEDVLDCLDSLTCEVVLTGRDPAPELRERADYLTEMWKARHPFDRGVCARTGVER